MDVQHLAAPHLGELVRDFLKGKITSVNPPFSLPHQRRNVLHRVNKRVGIGQEHQVVPVLVYTHTKDSILSQVHVAFVHELLVSLFFTGALLEQGVRYQDSQQNVAEPQLVLLEFLVTDFLADGLEVVLKQSVCSLWVFAPNGFHVVP